LHFHRYAKFPDGEIVSHKRSWETLVGGVRVSDFAEREGDDASAPVAQVAPPKRRSAANPNGAILLKN
jgi:hypothetical protein